MSDAPEQLASGLWSWSCRHPEWHPGEFGAEVVSFAARAKDVFFLIDPLLPEEDDGRDAILKLLDREAAKKPVAILITLPYHVRDAAELVERYGGAKIHGHPACEKRLDEAASKAFEPIEPGAGLPGGARAFAIGKPRRNELPLHLPAHDALVFGDAVVGVDGELRMWAMEKVDAKRRRFFSECFAPTLEPLLELEVDRVLVTHGDSVLSGGAAALRRATRSDPWYHRG